MAKKTVAADATKNYAQMHENLSNMTEDELVFAMQNVLDEDDPRVDMLTRIVGRYNRVRSNKATSRVLALLGSPKGKRDVRAALLGNDR